MSPDQFTSIANVFSAAALLLDHNGNVFAANRRLKQFGFNPQELIGRRLTEFVATAEEDVQKYLRACGRNREPVLGSLVLINPQGQQHDCRCDGAVVDHPPHGGKQLLIKFVPKKDSTVHFSILNRKLAELTEEVRRRQQLQNELYTQKESLRVTLRSIGDGVIVTDGDGRVAFLNSIAETLTGWSQEDAAGEPLTRVFHIINEQSRQVVDDPGAIALREGRVVGLANHTILIGRDGTERSIDDSAAPIRHQDGTIGGSVLVFRDISYKRATQIARARLAALVDSSNDAIIGQNFDGVITEWNTGAEELFGFTASETVGHSIFSTIAPAEQKEEHLRALQRVKGGEQVDHFETVRQTKDGRLIPVSIRISPIYDAEHNIIGASAIDRDITEQRRLEQSLRFVAEASKTLSSLIDNKSMSQKIAALAVPDFADWCAVDLVGPKEDWDGPEGPLQRVAVAHVDPAKMPLAEDLLQRYPPPPDAVRGVMKVLRTGESEMVTQITDELLQEVAQDDEHLAFLRDLDLQSYLCVPLIAKESILGVITFVFTESGRQYQDHDLAMAEDFGRRAAIAIENSQLYEKLREAERHKDEFLAMLAHELRNPLAPIRSGLEILAMDAEHHRDTIELMQEQVGHVTRLVDDLLDVSRIIRSKVELRCEPVDLGSLVKRSLESVRPLIDDHQQELVVSVPSQPMWVHADPVRLVQVIGNLLSNASKYTNPGGRIELAAQPDHTQAVIEIRDTGVGIEPALLGKVFELFTQSARSLDRAEGGLGIGLTLVKRLVEMHQGNVTAHSKGPGHGSSFVVRLPMIETPAPAEPQVDSPPATSGHRILVVDDNVGAARLLSRLLMKLDDHQIELAHTGPSALAKIKETQPEIVLLDIGLPGMNGHEVAEETRQDRALDNVLLVAVTGYGQEQDRQKSHAAGFDEHLVKPVSVEQIRMIFAHPKLAQ